MVLFDSFFVLLAIFGSFSLSKNYWYSPTDDLFWIIFGAPVIAIPIFFSFRLYRSVTRYIGFKALSSIIQAVTLYAVVWGFLLHPHADAGVGHEFHLSYPFVYYSLPSLISEENFQLNLTD